MKKKSRSKDRKTMKPRLVAAPALPQAQGGALAPDAGEDDLGVVHPQHNEMLVEDR